MSRRKGRIVEVEEVDTGERFYGSARRMKRLVDTLRVSSGELVTLGFGCLTAILRLGSPPPRKLNQGRALGDANDVLARANRFPGSCVDA